MKTRDEIGTNEANEIGTNEQNDEREAQALDSNPSCTATASIIDASTPK